MPLAGWCVDPEVFENIRVHIILLVCCNDGMSFSGYGGELVVGLCPSSSAAAASTGRAGAAGFLLLVVLCRW